ncbi:LacI family DNA-binding transcriptional regulator [Tepidanaerobacter syntrophicus]|uniref:LacI family transcriptional regulator n=1 Tax=Tepidanaerobacter syntrophicus TaxID=224999 RepID=A0A0U9HDD4_9FIRM|nr:LacI family DNA-binding transcriptional regulator [Tepidanaerobacter syntrophicus]GAQ24816.1 LacI family transcriptional regulator [Tepidanaerobacter syntrophicus]GLI18916.1 LacI family transcriptional regulator [Tepidanaerobacter syntrophicus]
MSITIKDIAEKAGVSITTVSKIINKKDDDISDKTRNKVLKVIDEYNYIPSALATGLVTKKTNTIGLLLPDISNAFFAELARGVEDGANCEGYNVILCNTDDDPEKENQYLSVLKSKHVDGIVFLSTALSNHGEIRELNSKGFPVIVLDRAFDDEDILAVFIDNVMGGYLATKHLTEFGHEAIGCITGPLKPKLAIQRLEGYKKALKEAHIDFNEELIYEGNFKTKSGELGAKKLLKAGATAIFASNDMMAYGVYKAVHDEGLSIPYDISVVGFDDIFLSEILSPPLTSVKQPTYEMGIISAAMLIKKIKNEELKQLRVEYKPTLSVRKSVAFPADKV